MAADTELCVWALASETVWNCFVIMGQYQRPPEPPTGYSAEAVWMRQMVKYVEGFFIRSVNGGKLIPDARGGYNLVIPKPKAASNQAGIAGLHFGLTIEFPTTTPYPAVEKSRVIHLQGTHPLCTTGIRDATNPTGPVVVSRPGWWYCIRDVPAQSTNMGGQAIWHLPLYPPPSLNNYDDPTMYWAFRGDEAC